MRVLLLDLDSKIPNLALMKLSAWHKGQGDHVYMRHYCEKLDRVYAASVFTKSEKQRRQALAVYPDAICGGTGFDLTTTLPDEVEAMCPDYLLYDMGYSLGFTSRGCIRKCPFCVVPQKEGGIREWQGLSQFVQHRKVRLLDNNFLASPLWKDKLEEMIERRLVVNFDGLDIRLLTDIGANLLARLNPPYLRFAFDHVRQQLAVERGIAELRRAGYPINRGRIGFYVLVGYDSTHEEDLHRCNLLHALDCNTHIQVYEGSPPKTRALARWANRPWLWAKCSFDEYRWPKKGQEVLIG